MLVDNLEICLITYNRRAKLSTTLQALFDDKSPVRDCRITVLDNHSTDGSAELIREYAARFSNIRHIRHARNIGGGANAVRAFEVAQGNYLWVLCDDDVYDWSVWNEVEHAIRLGVDAICVARYALPDHKLNDVANQLLQLTYLPGGIYKTANFTVNSVRNAYDNAWTLLPQCSFAIALVNGGKQIHVVSRGIVNHAPIDSAEEVSYTRGNDVGEIPYRTKTLRWIVGYASVCSALKDHALKHRALRAAIEYKGIHGSFENFCLCMNGWYADRLNWVHVLTVFLELDSQSQRRLLQSFMQHQRKLILDEQLLFNYFLAFGVDDPNLFRQIIPEPDPDPYLSFAVLRLNRRITVRTTSRIASSFGRRIVRWFGKLLKT